MQEASLYRKYRPQVFADVLGQDAVVRSLEGAIKTGKISHAYLFAGSRGTGKTSIARIFARDIGTSAKDLYEIDAASNRGIDDVRALRESVHTMPFDSPYKVYLIDEAHMLTKEAANALLKTLEEPPAHVIFILATTEPEKLPDTIVSRCETYRFLNPSIDILSGMLSRVVKSEGFSIDPSGIELIALLGEGSFRDTLGILQKVISFSHDTTISLEEVEAVTGAPRIAKAYEFLEAVAKGDAARALGTVEEIRESGSDVRAFLSIILTRLRLVLLDRYKALGKKESALDPLERARIAELSSLPGLSSKTLGELLEAEMTGATARMPHMVLELAVFRLLSQTR